MASVTRPSVRSWASLVLFTVACLPARAAVEHVVIAADGGCDYQIVTPDTVPDLVVEQCLRQTGRLIQHAFRASGFELPIVKERDRAAGKPCIYLGATAFARANGCDPAVLEGWSYFHRVVGRDVVLAGRDEAPPDLSHLGNWNRFFYYRLGTLKATADFLRLHAQTYFLYPGNAMIPTKGASRVRDWVFDDASIEFTEMPSISIPADLNLRKDVFTRYHKRHHRHALLYDVASNFFPRVDDALLGHTYGKAVPPKTYRESNPEYFALLGGERTKNNQYCLSNPRVRELIYEFTASFLAAGCQSVNIQQPDGFRPCQCKECDALYDTGKDWGEKLWTFHRDIAERLKQEHPGKKLLLSPYTVTIEPPKTFDTFPDNVIISHVDANFEETTKWCKWRKLHTGEYGIWIHNWIANQTSRYTPQRTPLFIEKQVKFFQEYGVRGIFRDGLGEVYGLEGPTYYVFGRMFDDPANLTARELVFEFCDSAFGPDAGASMRRFYDALYHSIELYALYLNTHGVGWTYKDIYGRGHKAVRDPFRMLSFLYPPRLIKTLETYLVQAESKAVGGKHRARLQLVRREFDFLKALMRVIHLYHAYETEPTLATRERVLNAIDDRNALTESMFSYVAKRDKKRTRKNDRARPIEGWGRVLFPPGGHNVSHLQLVHNIYGNTFADTALNWDTAAMRKAPLPGASRLTAIPAIGEVRMDSPAWAQASAGELHSVEPGAELERTAAVRVLYGAEALYLRLEAQLEADQVTFEDVGRDGDLKGHESLDIYLGPIPGEDRFYRFRVGLNPGARFDAARGLITDRMHLLYSKDDPEWNGEWSYESRVDKTTNRWIALLSLPYETLVAEPPAEGTSWRFNVGRTHVVGPDDVRRSIWSSLGGTRDVGNRDALGVILFQADAGKENAAAEVSPATRWRLDYWKSTFRVPSKWKNLPEPLPAPLGPWLFRLDSIEKGVTEKWFRVDVNTDAWEPIEVPALWDEFKWGRYEGQAWYRTAFTLPASWQGASLRLLFGSVDEEAWIFVNGELVGEHSSTSTGRSINELWEEPFEVSVASRLLKYDQANTLVVRVNNTKASGGIWRPVLGCRQQ
ncbi:MAG: DUF4838 domain-containing protein [Lentisphaerae bacterium]|jgi:hypothetical protein|nr:DUF4838 domain-containing protein [Lentisphaerota bacterium]MBT7056288.1 DUF4838 domain-containing protein [Lentisphaerota bacterium]MBT7844153.1 DUF4838 domain-containing protein [Lentisphaerota bacterium]